MLQTNVIKNCFLTFCIVIGIAGIAVAQTQSNMRTCVANEVIISGGVTYIRCQEGNSEIWLGVQGPYQDSVQNGEQISFSDTAPLNNFTSKSLGRSFSKLYIISSFSRLGQSVPNSKSENNVYSGDDDIGTLVFSDDPSKVKKLRKPIGKTKADGTGEEDARNRNIQIDSYERQKLNELKGMGLSPQSKEEVKKNIFSLWNKFRSATSRNDIKAALDCMSKTESNKYDLNLFIER